LVCLFSITYINGCPVDTASHQILSQVRCKGASEENVAAVVLRLYERTIIGGDLFQTVVLCPGNANIRVQDSIFAVLEGISDHMTRASSLGMGRQISS
jgi:hypothetical protein